MSMIRTLRGVGFWSVLLWMLVSCGGGSGPLATRSDVQVTQQAAGATPFVAVVRLEGEYLRDLKALGYVVAPKAGAAAKPVSVTHTVAALARAGYLPEGGTVASVPVVGLYAGRSNAVTLTLTFVDDSQQALTVPIVAPPYVDPAGVYDRPTLRQTVAGSSPLGFSYVYVKSGRVGPVVIDIDGEVRWIAPVAMNAYSSAFIQNGFVVGATDSLRFQRIELDGRSSASTVIAPSYTAFHHNIDPGKLGWLGQFDALYPDGRRKIESLVTEFDPSTGAVLKEWDFAAILGDHMRSQGDDPDAFIRPGIDWFHVNAATYDPRDDSVIVSSRENFVIKVDHQSGRILWIFGDPTKYWYTFPSLRAKALQLDAGGLYPLGQHATSITSDGLLMLFNNGAPSFNQPAGAPVGETRPYSAVTAYRIDPTRMTATEVWRFDHGRTIRSDVCSSVYEAPGRTLLVTYSAADNRSKARIVGLDAARNVVFDFEYPSIGTCTTGWNAEPFRFDALSFR